MNGATLFLVTAVVYITAKGKWDSYAALVHRTVSDAATASTGSAGASAAPVAATNGSGTTAASIVNAAAAQGLAVSFQ